jgi:hypothetical protein
MATHKKWRKTLFSTPSAVTHDAYDLWTGDRYNQRFKKKRVEFPGFDSLAQGMFDLTLSHIINYTSIKFRTIIENDFCRQDGIRETEDSLFRAEIEDRLFYLYEELLARGNLSPKVMEMAGKIVLK